MMGVFHLMMLDELMVIWSMWINPVLRLTIVPVMVAMVIITVMEQWICVDFMDCWHVPMVDIVMRSGYTVHLMNWVVVIMIDIMWLTCMYLMVISMIRQQRMNLLVASLYLHLGFWLLSNFFLNSENSGRLHLDITDAWSALRDSYSSKSFVSPC